MAAALALGAEGVWCGSVWLTTEEAETHPVGQGEVPRGRRRRDTVRSRSLTGQAGAQAAHRVDRRVGQPGATPSRCRCRCRSKLVAEAQERIQRTAHNRRGDRPSSRTTSSGQIVGSLNHVKSVRAVMEEFALEYADTMERLDEIAEP